MRSTRFRAASDPYFLFPTGVGRFRRRGNADLAPPAAASSRAAGGAPAAPGGAVAGAAAGSKRKRMGTHVVAPG
jgi:hypothetical protein